MARAIYVALTAALVACAPRPSDTAVAVPAGAVLRWGVSQGLWGSEELVVERGGAARYRFDPAGASGAAKREETTVTDAELAAIERAMVENDFCGLSSDRLGVPDEGKPTLAVRLGEISCSVTLWDGEWRDDERAVAVLAALRPLFTRLGASAP